jgi:hypothetical protein
MKSPQVGLNPVVRLRLRAAALGYFLDATRLVRAEVIEHYYVASQQPGAGHTLDVDFTARNR